MNQNLGSTNGQTRRQRLEKREESIVSAAHEEFLENGFEGAKMAKIASRAGVAEGTIYLYFKNKNALLGAVVGAFYARLTEGAASGVMDCASTTDRLKFLARHHLKSCLDEWSILALAVPAFYQVNEYRDSEFFGFNRTYVAVFDNVIREGISRGDIRDDLPPHQVRDLFYGTLEHSLRTYMVRSQDLEDDTGIDQVTRQVMSMVLPAVGFEPQEAEGKNQDELSAITRRLEAVTIRLTDLEKVSPLPGTRQ